MEEWKQVAALLVPLFMNWWEVRKLRREVMAQRRIYDDEIAKIKADMNKLWAFVRKIANDLAVVR